MVDKSGAVGVGQQKNLHSNAFTGTVKATDQMPQTTIFSPKINAVIGAVILRPRQFGNVSVNPYIRQNRNGLAF